jgi:hypothetical protein
MKTEDRAIEEIVLSMSLVITRGQVKGQFARDLEKLLIYRKMEHEALERIAKGTGDPQKIAQEAINYKG